ncbi:hypothetical protein [Echinicola rosea]|uniref:Uncharacterized protein n=1 Tax=Echinicola rosea TaxID=1807691 RepID=A0ABQ1VBJ0_9BACT|nr:hypothetical protein [Echinicola rosea]GGF49071.1 hypothetical protein GCM10011339_42100 [Echinicola rosea]
MISTEELIEELILQDLKHCQLLYGLRTLELGDGDAHYLGILELIEKLMGIRDDQLSTKFCEIYMKFMHQSTDFSITFLGQELRPLARSCYLELKELSEK